MTTNASSKLGEHYNDKIMAKIVDRFKLDFDAFHYDTELPVTEEVFQKNSVNIPVRETNKKINKSSKKKQNLKAKVSA